MAYLSLYRRWRPQTFAQVVGQQHVVRTLQNALRSGHVAHAYLFAGPRGTGKTTIARLLAKGLNCARGVTPEPCRECESCRRIADGTSLDCLEIDGASNRGIDEIRELRERSKFAPQEGPYKVYIIDEVHMLTTEAFNALLKTLEEPPEHVVFVLATTEAHKVPATILSRCQRFDFHRFGEEDVAEHLSRVCAAEGVQATPEALRLIARHAEGGMRDALSLLEQCVVYAGADTDTEGESAGAPDAASRRTIDEETVAAVLGLVPGETIERFYRALKAGDVAAALGVVEEVFAGGADIRQFVHTFAVYLRELLLATAGSGPEAALLLQWVELLADAEVQLRAGASPRFVLDLLVLRLALGRVAEVRPVVVQPAGEQAGEKQEVASRLAELESRVARLEEMLLRRQPGAAASFWEAAEMVRRQGEGPPAHAPVQAPADAKSSSHVRPPAEAPVNVQPQAQAQGRAAASLSAPAGEGAHDEARSIAQAQTQVEAQAQRETQAQAQGPSVAQAQAQAEAQARALAHTPAGSPAPAAGAGAEATCVPGEELASAWEMILAQVRQRSIQVQALLREARPAILLGDTLHLVLPAGCAFHKSGLEQPRVLEMLERVVSRALRRATHLKFHLGELPADLSSILAGARAKTGPPTGPQPGPQPSPQPGPQTAPRTGSGIGPNEPAAGPAVGPAVASEPAVQAGLPVERWEQADALLNHPLVKRALELFGGRVVQVIPAESRPPESPRAENQ